MARFLLQLGRIEQLALKEVENLFPAVSVQPVLPGLVLLETADAQSFLDTISQSAGVVKSFQILQDHLTEQQAQQLILDELQSLKKPTFSITQRADSKLFDLETIKQLLAERKVSSRFLHSPSGFGLSAAVLRHKAVQEFFILTENNLYTVAKTNWIQDIDEWSERDYGKPARDRKRGMLPPKLARMMIHLLSPELRSRSPRRLYDPFSGTGTVLMEGSLLDWEVYGSDLSGQAIQDTAQNMQWLRQHTGVAEPKALFVADVVKVSLSDLKNKMHAIVTEPFLGKVQPRPDQLPNIFKGLEKLYLGAFKQWTQLLEDGGEVVIVTPLVETEHKVFDMSRTIDNISRYGYTVLSGPYLYTRPQTIVKRAIYHLKFTSSSRS